MRYFENLVIQYASLQLIPQIISNVKSSMDDNSSKSNSSKDNFPCGTKFQFSLQNSTKRGYHQFQFSWLSKKMKKGNYLKQYLNWLGLNLMPHIGINEPIFGCTEYHRKSCIFRAHPNFRGKGSWYDWAMFQWETDDGYIDVPAQIIMFLTIPDSKAPFVIDNRLPINQGGLYALVESCEDVMKPISKSNRIFDIQSKKTTMVNRRGNPRKEISDKCIFLVHVDTINNPIAAIPNMGKEDDVEYIILRPCNQWYKGFSHFINGNNNI